jgi:ABC-type nitrate/sulfonate/bicarbonate transport system substrate-binding protein
MKKVILLFFLLVGFFSCQQNKNPSAIAVISEIPEDAILDTIHLALDWTPNVLHAGIFWAEQRNWFKEEGIFLYWDTPEIDNYTKKPVLRLLDGEVDLAVGPSEHLFAFAVDSSGAKAQAVATILQDDRSAFVIKSDAKIKSPAEIGDATYLGYHTPLEHEILDAMIIADGGEPEYKTKEPGRLAVWDGFMQDSGQVAWVFLHWEAMLAKNIGQELSSFIPNEYGVPYGYSSVIMAPNYLNEKDIVRLKRFLKVLDRAYKAIATNPIAAAQNLRDNYNHSNFQDSLFVNAAMENIHSHFLNTDQNWGLMQSEKWKSYSHWMKDRDLIRLSDKDLKDLFTNKYLPKQ